MKCWLHSGLRPEEEEGVEWRIQFEGLSAECILVVAARVVHCSASSVLQSWPVLTACTLALLQRPGPMYRRAGLCRLAWHLYPACSECSQPLLACSFVCPGPAPLSPLPAGGPVCPVCPAPATADSLQFRPETAAAGTRATGLLQALGG